MADKKRRAKKRTGGGRSTRSQRLSDALISQASPSFNAWHMSEPRLIFAGGQAYEDPKTGLTLYGPAALDNGPRTTIRLGIIGTGETIQLLKNWVRRAECRIIPGLNARRKPYDPILAPDFPGFGDDSAFQCRVQIYERLCSTLTSEIESCLSEPDFTSRTRRMVTLVSERLCVLADKDPQPDVVVCAMPKNVEDACGPAARDNRIKKAFVPKAVKAERRRRERDAKSGQLSFSIFDDPTPTPASESYLFRDFHNALKAHAMKAKLPTQLLWESTLRGGRDMEDPATTAWNFFTALYYKAGNMPWELQFSVPRTCFVGITFYRESPDPNSPTRTCLAQAFSESGEGLVLRGERVTWDKERDKKPHLNAKDAESILRKVIDLYKTHFNGPPHRVVVHKTSRYWPEELQGFKAALGDIHSYDFLALERRGIRFLRLGTHPPVRGTVIELGRRNYLVYTRGYIPFLRMYPGMRIPNPLEVVEHFGDSSAEKVCTEILALTKLNWNTCAFASADPVTIAFSKQVATIIKELPEGVELLTKYRYYM